MAKTKVTKETTEEVVSQDVSTVSIEEKIRNECLNLLGGGDVQYSAVGEQRSPILNRLKYSYVTVIYMVDLAQHSLNNQTTEGNIQNPTYAYAVVYDGDGGAVVLTPDFRIVKVSAISGYSLRNRLQRKITDNSLYYKLNVCKSCQSYNASKADGIEGLSAIKTKIAEAAKDKTGKGFYNPVLADLILQACDVDDIMGMFSATKGFTLNRKSIINMAYAVGVPEYVETEREMHVRHDAMIRPGSGDPDNQGAAMFHNYTSTGSYLGGFEVNLDRLGYNDYTYDYPITLEGRKLRAKALFRSLGQWFDFEGAMTSTKGLPLLGARAIIIASKDRAFKPPIPRSLDNLTKLEEVINKENERGVAEGIIKKDEKVMELFVLKNVYDIYNKLVDIGDGV